MQMHQQQGELCSIYSTRPMPRQPLPAPTAIDCCQAYALAEADAVAAGLAMTNQETLRT